MTATPTLLPVYEALARDIKSHGIESVFGLMSDDTALLVSTLDAIGVKFHSARHENNAVAMAEGYACASGKLGVAIIGRGPATANAMHGAAYASRTGSRVLLVFGASALTHQPVDRNIADSKNYNSAGVLEAAGIKTYVASDPGVARQMLANAISATRHAGCVALLLPTNVQMGQVDYPGALGTPEPRAPVEAPRQRVRAAALNTAMALLASSRRPLILAGLGAHRAGARAALEQLAGKLGAVLATTLKAKDLFHGHPYNAGIVGSYSHAAGRRAIEQADCVLVFGAGLNNRTTSFGAALPAGVPVIQVDLNHAQIGRWHAADVALIGDARAAAEQLLQALPDRAPEHKPWHGAATRDQLANVDLAAEFHPANTSRTMDPRSAALVLDRLLPPDRNAVYDAGNFLQIMPFISGLSPNHNKNSVDFGSIGMGFGTALGFAVGAPDRTTVLFIGDGGFLMTLGELDTAARAGLPFVIVVMNDSAYGAELHFLKMRNMPVSTAMFADIDFAPIAEAFGFEAVTVRTLDELEALAPRLAKPDSPILIDCKINASIAAAFLLESPEVARPKS